MLEILQWAGSLGIIAANFFIVSHPRQASVGILMSCVVLAIWATLVGAWGVLTLELFVGGAMARNIRLTFNGGKS